jgi:hypothetical protein
MKKLILFVFLVIVAISFSSMVLADGPVACPEGTKCLPNPLNTTGTIFDLVKKVIDWVGKTLAPIIATLMVIIGAFQMIFSNGDPKKFDTGRKTILYTVIGYAILLLGWGITTIVSDILKL